MLKKISLPLQLLLVIVIVLFFGSSIPHTVSRAALTFSFLFKELLNFLLPIIVFTFVATGISAFKRNGPVVVALLLGMVFASNAVVAMISYLIANGATHFIACNVQADPLAHAQQLVPFFTIQLPRIFRSDYMMLAGIILGVVSSLMTVFDPVMFLLNKVKGVIEELLSKILIPLLPLYVFGFLMDIYAQGTFTQLFAHYGSTVVLIVAAQILYLLWFYWLAAGFSFSTALFYIKNAIPSYITAFSTMSSAATIPVTVASAEKNTHNSSLSRMAVPIMANVHLLGDAISTPMLALVTLVVFKSCIPAFGTYMLFVLYFCTAMFAVSGIPGGGILVMLPILRTYLGFNSEMESVITALYFLLDSFGTAANVMGDGALIIMLDKILKKLGIK